MTPRTYISSGEDTESHNHSYILKENEDMRNIDMYAHEKVIIVQSLLMPYTK